MIRRGDGSSALVLLAQWKSMDYHVVCEDLVRFIHDHLEINLAHMAHMRRQATKCPVHALMNPAAVFTPSKNISEPTRAV